MAELLVTLTEEPVDDPYIDCKRLKRGDVSAIQADGSMWGTEELSSPQWVLIKVKGLTVAQCLSFLAPELDTDPQNPSRMLQSRAFKLDLDSLPQDIKDAIATRNTKYRSVRADFTLDQLLSYKVAKPPIPDPNIL